MNVSYETFASIWIVGVSFLLSLAFLIVILEEPRKALIGAILTGAAMGIILDRSEAARLRSEISPSKYAAVDDAIEAHPNLAPLARRMLSDGIATESEFRAFRRKARTLDDAATKKRALESIEARIDERPTADKSAT